MSSNSVCPTFRKVLVASAFGACVFMIPNGVHSATSNSATLQWAANQETDLAGYRVYHGTTSGNYGGPQNVGMTPSYQYTNLEPNKTHYFSVTAYDTAGNESPPSPEVSKTIISELAEAAQLQEEQRLAEAAQLQGPQQLAKAAQLEQWKAAKAAQLEQWKAAKAAQLLAKIQRILGKIEQKLITYADNPKVMDQLNRQKVELLAKQDKIRENQPI